MKITVDIEAHQYVTECVRAVDGEVGGIAYIELVEYNKFYISEFVLLPQKASSAHVDFDDKSYVEEITRAAEQGRENELRCSWHSHGSMNTYFSATDEDGIKEYKQLGMPWLVSLVFNHAGDIASRIDIFDAEVSPQITISDLDYELESIQAIRDTARHDVKQFVREEKAWNTSKMISGVHTPAGWKDKDDDKDDFNANKFVNPNTDLNSADELFHELFGTAPPIDMAEQEVFEFCDRFIWGHTDSLDENQQDKASSYLKDEYDLTEDEVKQLMSGD